MITINPKFVLNFCCALWLVAGVTTAADADPFAGPDADEKPKPASPEEVELRAVLEKLGPRAKGIDVGVNDDGKPELGVDMDEKPDLSVLRGLPVRNMRICGSMPLLASGEVFDLSPLAGMPLESLWIWKVPLKDIAPLKTTRLNKLLIMGAAITDISPLKGLPLTDLNLWSTDVSNIYPLKGMRLKHLNIDSSESARVEDLTPLKGMSLESLQFHANGVTKGIEVVRGMKSLKEINETKPEEFWKEYDAAASTRERIAKAGLKFTKLGGSADGTISLWFHGDDIVDLAPLKGLPVMFLGFRDSKVSDLRPLAGLPLLGLCIKSNALTDLSPLRETPIKELYLDSENLTDLSPLKGTKVETLSLGCQKLTELSAIRKLPLKNLYIKPCGVTDLSPLEGMSLESIEFDPERITKGLEALRDMKSLKRINRNDAKYFLEEHDGRKPDGDDTNSKDPFAK